jgi:ferredoxin--NADP+ reductase
MEFKDHSVAVIGAGPAGIFAAKELAKNGVQVLLFNRDIKPGGLAEYGIYPDKTRIKAGLRIQFESTIQNDGITYFGNITIGSNGFLNLSDIRKMGVDAICITTGAQGTKWLGIPGEDLNGVFHAKDLVYHYNLLPPYSTQKFQIGKNVAIIGVGNVMMDIARYLIHEKQVDSVTAIARRGPGEIKFSKKEMEYIGQNFDRTNFIEELEKASSLMRSLGQDPNETLKFVDEALGKADYRISNSKFRFKFLVSSKKILSDDAHNVLGLELEENTLINENGKLRAKGLGNNYVLGVDTVIFAIGDSVDPSFGLPIEKNQFVKNANPRFPVNGESFESYDPTTQHVIDDVFLAGWARKASDGLVGIAKKDGVQAAQAIMEYLTTITPNNGFDRIEIERQIKKLDNHIVDKFGLQILKEEENRIAEERNIPEFKFDTNAEMLSVIEHKKMLI